MKCILSLLLTLGAVWGEWIMFADKSDTYLYNNQTGEVYIRHKKNKKNYEDVFIKMPHGISPEQIQPPLKPTQSEKNNVDDLKMQSLKKTQDLMNDALKGTF